MDATNLSRIERREVGLTVDRLQRIAHEMQLKELERLLEPWVRNGGDRQKVAA